MRAFIFSLPICAGEQSDNLCDEDEVHLKRIIRTESQARPNLSGIRVNRLPTDRSFLF